MAEIITERILEELTSEGVTMVTVSIDYPIVTGVDKKALKRINAFYGHQAVALLRHVKKRIMSAAIAEYSHSLAKSTPFKPFEVSASFVVTYDGDDILSIYRDVHIRGGGYRASKRKSETWDTVYGWFVELTSFFPSGENYRKVLIKSAIKTVEKQRRTGANSYFENFQKLIRKNFSPHNFYITDEGITIFFNETTIAPRAEGILVFVLPQAVIDV